MASSTGKLADLGNMINGVVGAPIGGEYMDSIEPGTGNVLCRIPSSDKEDVAKAVAAAKAALTGPWSGWTAAQRAALLDAVADEIDRRSDELAVLESRDSGKPVSIAKSVDVARAASNFRFFAGALRHDSDDCFHMADAINYTQRQPVG
jgi:acyl-CoA reductase-like NAD-dependent aldehyde dehydrogenase